MFAPILKFDKSRFVFYFLVFSRSEEIEFTVVRIIVSFENVPDFQSDKYSLSLLCLEICDLSRFK